MTDLLVAVAAAPGELVLQREGVLRSTYEVLDPDGQVVAELTYRLSGDATARTVEGEWALSRAKGLRARRLEVIEIASSLVVARITMGYWSRGATAQIDSFDYVVTGRGLLNQRWTLLRDGDEAVVIRPVLRGKGVRARIVVTDTCRTAPRAALLLLVALHVQITTARQAG